MKEEKYINPFTDFGFEKLFGEKAFQIAEISKFTEEQKFTYEERINLNIFV